MLTKRIVNSVKAIHSLSRQIDSITKEKEEMENDLIHYLESQGHDLNNIIVTGFEIVESPYGVLEYDNTYVNEHCEDSLFCPDGGSGEQYIPLENGDYLKLDYVW